MLVEICEELRRAFQWHTVIGVQIHGLRLKACAI